jgi:transposase
MTEVGMNDKLIGVDIGKRFLDVACEGVRAVQRHGNDSVAIARFVDGLDPECDIVIFERSGGYERRLEAHLAAAGIRWAVAHSRRVKAFRVAKGIKAKTDAIDSRLLRDFGRDQLNEGRLRFGRLENVTLAALVARRRQLDGLLHDERCRLETAAIDLVEASIARAIATLERELATIEAEIDRHMAADAELTLKQETMCQRIGVGRKTARSLLAVLPQLGCATGKEITALGGIAPRVHRSGTLQKRRGLDPGREAVKTILFYPAQTAARFDPEMKAFAQQLRKRGKPGKVIMVAVMHKMLVRLNAAVRDALNSSRGAVSAAPAAA